MNFFNLILEASIVVQIVILILLFFSIFSWAIIFFKRKTIKTASIESKKFMEVFRKSKNLNEVSEAAKKYKSCSLAVLFRYGYREQ